MESSRSETLEHKSASDAGPEQTALMAESSPTVVREQVADFSSVFAREHAPETVTATPSSVAAASKP